MPEQENIDPKTVSYTARPGEVAKTRTEKQILKDCKVMRFPVFTSSDGKLCAAVELNAGQKPVIVNQYDTQGRIEWTMFAGDRGMMGSQQFDNLYYFDEQGRLVIFEQQYTDSNNYTKLFKSWEYTYIEGRPDSEFTVTYTAINGKKTTRTYDERVYEAQSRFDVQGHGAVSDGHS